MDIWNWGVLYRDGKAYWNLTDFFFFFFVFALLHLVGIWTVMFLAFDDFSQLLSFETAEKFQRNISRTLNLANSFEVVEE